jgi:hypothetical protein
MVLVEWLLSTVEAQIAAVLVVVWVVWKYRRAQAILGTLIGLAGTAGFAGVVIAVAFGIAIAAGWLDAGALVGDLLEWGPAAWRAVGQPVIDGLVGLLEWAISVVIE